MNYDLNFTTEERRAWVASLTDDDRRRHGFSRYGHYSIENPHKEALTRSAWGVAAIGGAAVIYLAINGHSTLMIAAFVAMAVVAIGLKTKAEATTKASQQYTYSDERILKQLEEEAAIGRNADLIAAALTSYFVDYQLPSGFALSAWAIAWSHKDFGAKLQYRPGEIPNYPARAVLTCNGETRVVEAKLKADDTVEDARVEARDAVKAAISALRDTVKVIV